MMTVQCPELLSDTSQVSDSVDTQVRCGHACVVEAARILQLISVVMDRRMVEQTSVHEVLKTYGKQVRVPPDVCHIIHTRVALRGELTEEELKEDKRLWDFSERLIPNVDKALRRAGLLDMGDRQE